MSALPQILIVARDAEFRREIEAALTALKGLPAAMHVVADFRQAAEAARARQPDLAIVEMTSDMAGLNMLADELLAGSPRTTLVGAFRADLFDPEISESMVLIEALRYGVHDFVRRPISSGDMEQLLGRLSRKSSVARARFGKIVSFISNKGGVGKSTLAVNTACGLARHHPQRVLLVDAALQAGHCASMLDLTPRTSIVDALHQRDRLDETLIRQLAVPHASGVHLLAAPPSAVEAAEIDDEIVSRVLTLARRAYDFVLVDTFPVLDRTVVAVLDLSDRAYVVLENVVPTLLGGVKLMELLAGLGMDRRRLRVALNRFSRRGGSISPGDAAGRIGQPVDHVLPFHKGVIAAANLGEPYVLRAGRFSGHGRAIRRLVAEVDALAAEPTAGEPQQNGVPQATPASREDSA